MNGRDTVILVAIMTIAFVGGGWLMQRRGADGLGVYENARLMDDVVESVADLYVDSLTEADLYQLAIEGLLDGLEDPYAGFFEGEELERHTEMATGTYAGIGIRVETNDGWITIVTPIAGSPAAAAGLLAGDRIVSVEGQPTRGWTPDQSVAALRGEPGTVVEIEVARLGVPELLPFSIERSEIHVSAIRHQQRIDPDIGYIWLETVTAGSADELETAITALRDSGLTKLVLDLRRNPGGLLNEAIDITELFLDRGDAILETRTRVGRTSRVHRAGDASPWPDMPVVVLVDEYSASAAEIVAGALQDHDRALLVGETTFGKGLVQTVYPLRRDRALKITTGRWYTPLGRSIDRDPGIADSTRPTVTTPAGRILVGGGGVRPDSVLAATDSAGMTLSRVVGSRLQPFRNALAERAVERAADSTRTGVTRDELEEIRDRLAELGVTFSLAEWALVRDEVGRELEYLLARYRDGEWVERRLRLAEDPVVSEAVRLLEAVESTDELLGIS